MAKLEPPNYSSAAFNNRTRIWLVSIMLTAWLPSAWASLQFSGFADVHITQDTSDFQIPFSVSDNGGDPGTLKITAAASNPDVIPSTGLILAGTTTDWLLTITPAPGRTGSTQVTVNVTNQLGETASISFTVFVDPPPDQPPTFIYQPSIVARPGEKYQFLATVSDPEETNVVVRAVTLPSWLQLDSNTDVLDGIVPPNARDPVLVVLEADDGHQAAPVRLEFTIYMADIIQLGSFADIEAKRASLKNYIWGAGGWPTNRNFSDIIEYDGFEYSGIRWPAGNLDKIMRYTVSMDYGMLSYVFHFIPKVPNGRLVVYHSGHDDGVMAEDLLTNASGDEQAAVISKLIARGYAVVGISMPVYGYYHNPTVEIAPGVSVQLTTHGDIFRYLDHPFRFFLEPVAVTLNYCEDHFNYDSVYMTGLSGGGWTTTIYAAIDPRIKGSFPVAGSVPNYLRLGYEGLGDEEQDDSGFYRIANYSELYVMGAAGPGRMQLQILNRFDDCCFYGDRYTNWVEKVTAAVDSLGAGNYQFFSDDSQTIHKISPLAADTIIQSLPKLGVLSIGQIGDKSVTEGDTLEFKVPALDTDNPSNELVYTLPSPPTGAMIDPISGLFTWTPSEEQGPGTYPLSVVIQSANSPTLSATNQFTVLVLESNRPPVLEPVSDQLALAGESLKIQLSAADQDLPPNRLSYVLRDGPAGASLDPDTGLMTWAVPENQQPATNWVDIAVTDDGTPPQVAEAKFAIIVAALRKIEISQSSGQMVITWDASQDALYQLDSSASPAGPWTLLKEVVATGPICFATDKINTDIPAMYYRVSRLR
ncbi:hypothetical protein GC207_01260 [bacterium]|nr:hypothetical protein [bacterium]